MGGSRGRLISADDLKQAVSLINECCLSGASKKMACETLKLSVRTVERWEKEHGAQDRRAMNNQAPSNKLTKEESKRIIAVCVSKDYREFPPSKVVPMLETGVAILAQNRHFTVF